MEITKKEHKAILYQVLSVKEGNQRTFRPEDLVLASNIALKLTKDSEIKKTEQGELIEFKDGKLTFTLDEAKKLKDWFTEKQDWTLNQSKLYEELKTIFNK